MEIWKDMKGWEGIYQVSNYGRVKSLERTIYKKRGGILYVTEKILKPRVNTHGYMTVHISKVGLAKVLRIHTAVAQAFVPNPNNYPHINHLDGIKANNSADNLEWCTPLMNNLHAIATGLNDIKNRPGSRSVKVIHTPSGIVYPSLKAAAKALGIKYKTAQTRMRRASVLNTIQYFNSKPAA